MTIRRQDCRLAWLSLASLVLVLGLTLGTATGETPEPPMGLAAVNPATPMPAFSYQVCGKWVRCIGPKRQGGRGAILATW